MRPRAWSDRTHELGELFAALAFTDADRAPLSADQGFARWVDRTTAVRRAGGTIYLIGNGASASMASHMAADLAKTCRLHTQVFTDPALVTALSNDLGFASVYAEPLRRRAREGDMLVAISSSGASENILAAADLAREARLFVVTLTAFQGDNPLRARGNLNAYVPARAYGPAETCHAAVLHHWMDLMEAADRG